MLKFTIVLTVLIAISITTNGQIPNSGFENWTTVGSYENPTDWATMNAACAGPFYSCTKSTDHYPANVGNYSIRVENNTTLTQTTGGWGMAITDTMAYPFQPAFPVNGHPNKLCGFYKYNALNNDTMWIKIVFFNNGIMVFDEDTTAINTPTWSPFSITFPSYISADSATLMISAFYPSGPFDGPNGNSVIYIDNLSFDNFISSVQEQTSEKNAFILSPNPASNIVSLDFNNINNVDLTLDIYNVTGTLVKSEKLKQNQRNINIEDLSNGVYLVTLKSKGLIENKRLIIQR